MILIMFPGLIGAGLATLFVVGLATHATPWLTWLDGVVAAMVLGALAFKAGGRSTMNRGAVLGFAAAGLLVLWIVAVARHATPWLAWWVFAASLVALMAALASGLDGFLDLVPGLRLSRTRSHEADRNDHNQSQEVSMYRAIAIALGLGLIVLWIAGLAYHAPLWLTWLDGIAGILAFVIAGAFLASAMVGVAMSGSLALGLFVLWIVGLAARSALWMAWWTFGFGAAFTLLAVAAMAGAASFRRPHHA